MLSVDIVVFGTGKRYEKNKAWLKGHRIVAFLDNSAEKQGRYLDGSPIVPPETVKKLKYDIIVILSIYIDEMLVQLLELGVERQAIFDESDLGAFNRLAEIHMA